MSRFRLILVLFAIFSISLFAAASQAQITNVTNSTSTPIPGAGHDYIKLLSETVDPANGSVSLRLATPTPTGRQLSLPFFFAFDSNGVHFVQGGQPGIPVWNTDIDFLNSGGWAYSVPLRRFTSFSKTVQDNHGTATCTYSTGYIFEDPSGERHALDVGRAHPSVTNIVVCTLGKDKLSGGDAEVQAVLSSAVGGGLATPITTAVVDAAGTTYQYNTTINPDQGLGSASLSALPTFIEDRNGNQVYIHDLTSPGSMSATFNVTDTLGRTLLNVAGFGATGNSVTISGLANPYTLTWGSARSNFTVTWTPTSTSQSTGCGSLGSNTQTQAVITAVSLPNGQQYQFSYEPTYGELSKITYPSGGYVSYAWGLNSQSALALFTGANGGASTGCQYIYDKPAVLHRYVSFDGQTIALQQDFQYSTTWGSAFGLPAWTAKRTTVTSRDLVRGTTTQVVYNYSSISAPAVPYQTGYSDTQIPVEQSVLYQDGSGNTLRTTTKGWLDQYRLACQLETLDNGAISGVFYAYGAGSQVTDKKEYDYGLISSTASCQNESVAPNGITPTRETVTTYQNFAATPIYPSTASIFDQPCRVIVYDNTGTNKVAETDYFYDGNAATSTCPTSTAQALPGAGNYTGHDETNYGPTTLPERGNLTTKSVWINSSGLSLTTTYSYDETGQLTSAIDPRGNQTSYSYSDSYSSGTPPGPTNAYLTQVTHPNTGVAHIEKYSYAYSTGELTSSTDQNNLVTNYKYNDNLARLTETDSPDGGVVSIAYNDSPYNPSTPSPSVTTTKKINSSTNLVTLVAMDGLGHTARTELTSDPQGTIYADTAYDGPGRLYTVSNPYRSGSDPTTSSGTTTYIYDALGRKCVEIPQDGTAVSGNACPSTAPTKDIFTQYSGSTTTVTAPTGRKRQSTTDGLGRLIQVVEDPGGLDYVTNYTLDTLDNLKQVVQNGSHTRTFTYDFLSRLLTSNNPEVGAIAYNYDSDSNCGSPNSFAGLLVSKVDARGIRTCAQYDALNRQTVLNYSNGDPTVTTTYDGSACLGLSACQNIGHATSVTDAAGSESWAYQTDSANLRSVHVNQRTTSSITKTSTYYFNLAGDLYSVTYPSGRVINYTFDAANRPQTAADGSNGITYAGAQSSPPTGCLSSGVCYTPQGTDYSAAIGKTSSFTGVNFSETYNSRLQPLEIKAGPSSGNIIDITYSFVDPTSGGNAGHVNSITNNLDNTRSQNFTYDSLNRITGALTASTYSTSPSHCWGESYTLDAWGNLNSIAATTNSAYIGCSQESGFSSTADGNNHLPAWGYDASGNATSDGSYSYAYNAESQIKTAAGIAYLYDGSGRRVSKSSGKLYWYGSGGEILAETDASGNTLNEYIFFGGKRVAILPSGGNAEYYVEDMLGSSRLMTNNTGTLCYDGDVYPYGGERAYTNNCSTSNNYKFEGKERDTETGNDDFGARYYSNRFGRWLSADWSAIPTPIPYARLSDPQTLNLYAMVHGDPETFADLNGHDWFYVDKKWQWQKGHTYHDKDGNATKDKGYAGLLVAAATGTNKQGATTYKVTLYDQDKKVFQGNAFSGGNGNPAIKDGNYTMRLDIRDPNGPRSLNPNSALNNPPQFWGIQKMNDFTLPNGSQVDVTGAYGHLRTRLNPWVGADQGDYLHEQYNGAGYTHGCLCYGTQTQLSDILWNMPPQRLPVAVDVPVTQP